MAWVTPDYTYNIRNGALYRGNFAVAYLSDAAGWFGTDEAEATITTYAAANPDANIAMLMERHEAAKVMRQRAALFATGAPCYIRFGKLPRGGRSRNHITGELEAGVSVYRAAKTGTDEYIIDMRGVDAGSGMFIIAGEPSLITGDVVGTGSDGEPLLANCRVSELADYAITVLC